MQTLKILLTTLTASFSLHCALAQVPGIRWQKLLGGTENEKAYSVQQTPEGGYIIAGYTGSGDGDVDSIRGIADYWIVKLNGTGSIEWQKTFGGTGYDEATSIALTADGGYVVAGYSNSRDGDVTGIHIGAYYNERTYDYWIVKLDASGSLEWEKALGGYYNERAYSIQQTADNGYIIAGSSTSNDEDVSGHHGDRDYADYWIVKLDASGTLQWQKSLGGTGSDKAQAIRQTGDGGYIVMGESDSNDGDVTDNHGGYDYWVVKLSDAGEIEWEKSFGGSNGDIPNAIEQTADGGYIIAGYTFSTDGDVTGHHGTELNSDYWIVKLNISGDLQWQKALGGRHSELAYSIQETTGGGYIVAGQSKMPDGDVSGWHEGRVYAMGGDSDPTYDAWVVKLDGTGGIQWEHSYGGSGDDVAYVLRQTADGEYILAGSSNSNDGDANGNHLAYDEYYDTYYPSVEYWIVKLGGALGFEETVKNDFNIYPNPAGDFVTISNVPNGSTIQIADITGKSVYSSTIPGIQTTMPVMLGTRSFANGVYFIRVESDGNIGHKKFVVNK